MKTNLLADNWTFQNAGEFLCDGLNGDTASELVVPEDGESFHYREVSYDGLRFDALCQVLNHLVLSDEIWVDEGSTHTWEEFKPLAKAKDDRVVVPKPFSAFQGEWVGAREAIEEQLCLNGAMRNQHQANKQQWEKDRTNADGLLAQLIWGGAGMLARADYFKLPYAPHPSREKLVKRAVSFDQPDAGVALLKFVDTERLKIHQQLSNAGLAGTVMLPPIVVEVIEASSDLKDLVTAALQMRDQYKTLREWLGQVQHDISSENTKELLQHCKRYESISRDLSSRSSLTPAGDTTVQIGFSWLKVTTKAGSPINALLNRVGMRTEVNRLVLNPAGGQSLKKLLRLLGEGHSKQGKLFQYELIRRSAKQRTHQS